MINIPEEIKQLLKADIVNKNFRVHFPHGEHADLTNANVIEESVSLTESICSYEKLKFGLCESPFIEFETVGIPNIKGCTIECAIEIYCPETVEGAVYKEDLEAYVYSIPLGVFVVSSCRKKADMSHRLINAYSQVNLGNGDISSKILVDNQKTLDLNTFVAISLNDESILDDYTVESYGFSEQSATTTKILMRSGSEIAIRDWRKTTKVFEHLKAKITNGSTTTTETISSDRIYYRFYETRRNGLFGSSTLGNPTICRLYPRVLDDSENAEAFKNAILALFGIDKAVKYIFLEKENIWGVEERTGFVESFKYDVLYKLGTSLDGLYYTIPKISPIVSRVTRVKTAEFRGKNYKLNATQKFVAMSNDLKTTSAEYSSLHSLYVGIRDKASFSDATAELREIKTSETLSSASLNISGWKFDKVAYSESPIKINLAEIEGNTQEAIEGWIELQGKFGSIERDGSFELFDAKDNFIERNGTLTADDYSALWYDDDESLPIGRLICTWKDSEGKEYFSEKIIVEEYDQLRYRTYSITDNWFIQNYPYTSAQISAIFDEMSEHITSDIKYMPMELEIKGRPDIEVGDVFDIETSEGIITGFIEKRTLSGIDSMIDTITSEDEERATSNSSIKSSFDEETGTLTIYS